ncbi:DUF2971 domain-containing protein [Paenibacillus humicus]|uniref:DUF2971 domain-containing protein n=1 Tax=Paenibacillus humicus TaxID=412861 RepID=UPI003F13C81B
MKGATLDELKNKRDQYGLLCWHKHTTESLPMWKMYTSGGKGVAIKTTVKDLKNALNKLEESCWIDVVSYDSRKSKKLSIITPDLYPQILFHKDPIYKSEFEVRAIIELDKQSTRSKKVHLNSLIHEVVISPYSFQSTASHLKQICSQTQTLDPNKIRSSTCIDSREHALNKLEPFVLEEIEHMFNNLYHYLERTHSK